MLVKFVIASLFITLGGPLHNEGNLAKIENEGLKSTLVTIWEARDKTTHNDNTRYND